MILRILDSLSIFIFFWSFPILVVIFGKYNYISDYITSQFRDDTSEVYDFIIVGAGSAGAVVANRLSKNNKVLLIEAGGDPVFFNTIPMLAPVMLGRPEVDWMYKTVPQKNSQWAMKDQRSSWPRGKLLGGTSNLVTLNSAIPIHSQSKYARGHPLDFDNWANITGDPEWKFENVLPYFKKSINYHGKHSDNEKHYGYNPYGYLHVETRTYLPMERHFIDAGKELGYNEVDLNGPQVSGFSIQDVTQRKGQRFGTYPAFLKNFMHRSNLRVSKYSQAIKIKLDKNQRAEGVWFVKHGKKMYATASKEIIVSSGSIDSPKLLMLSGIGPKDHLKSVGIKPRVDLPVGKRLQDHLALIIFPFLINDTVSQIPERDFGLHTFYDYFARGTGPFTLSSGMHSHAFISSSYVTKEGIDWPDIQLYFMTMGVYEEFSSDFSSMTSVKKELLDKYLEPFMGKDGFILMLNLARVKTRGEIKLANKDPMSKPVIDPRYLEDKHDLNVLLEGFRFAMKLAEGTKSFKALNTRLADKHLPGCEKHKLRSDAYYECYIRSMGMTLYHPVGTCSMGQGVNDPNAVLDSKLRVLKTKALRVIDASIMPEIVTANTNAQAIMIGEKGADMIREYWSEQFSVCERSQRLFKQFQKKCFYSKLV